MMKLKTGFLLLAVISCTLTSDCLGQEQVKVTEGKGGVLEVSHPEYLLKVDSQNGGTGELVSSTKIGKIQPTQSGKISLFRECFSQTDMEGKAPQLKFSSKITHQGKTKAIIILETKLNSELAGKDLDGAVLIRKMFFDADKPYIAIEEKITNPSKDQIFYALLGIQNQFFISRGGFESTWMPTSRNVVNINRRDGKALGYYAKKAWEYAPVEGWLAASDLKSARGLVFIFDYNTIESFYNHSRSGTMGWFADGGQLPPGESFVTRYMVIPTKGFKGYSFASPELLADVNIKRKGGKIIIENTLLGLKENGPVSLQSELYGVRSKKTVKMPVIKIDNLTATPITKILKSSKMAEPVVFKVKITGENLDYSYEKMDEGGFRSQPLPFLPLASEYNRPVPPKKVKKVKTANIASPISKQRQALLFFGMYTQWYKFHKILEGWKVGVFNARPEKIEFLGDVPASKIPKLNLPGKNFKGSFFDYPLIILSDTTLEALPRPVIIKLKFYLESGGNLLVLGGPYAYGAGRYHEKGLDNILPVTSSAFDLKWKKQGVAFKKSENHSITREIDFSSNPMLYWVHKTTPKPEAKILVNAGEFCPLLVTGKYGKGRVVCFLGTPLGLPLEKQQPYWEWDGWVPLIKQTIAWLTKDTLKSN